MSVCVLQHASNLEQKQNETENKKVHGDVVKYGTVMQVNDLFLIFFDRITNMKRLFLTYQRDTTDLIVILETDTSHSHSSALKIS